MPLRRRLQLAGLIVLLIGLFAFWIAPFAVARGVRAWLWWQGRRQGLQIEVGRIDAPLLRPVVIQHLHVVSVGGAPCRIDLKATRTIVDLQLARILTGASGHALHALTIDELSVETRCYASGEPEKSKLSWPTLEKLLPENLKIDKLDLRIENGASVILLRNASVSAGPIGAGHFHIGEFLITSPMFRQTFSDLHGAADWHDNRLVLGGFNLARGLTVQSMTTDLSHLKKQNVGMEFDIDAFGGKLRASVSNEWHAKNSNWNIAGSATAVSLAQTSEAFGFTNRIGGMVHACKFTFRGNARDLAHATASIWLELTDSSWAGRTSELIMVGAALNNRQIQLQQLYVKQRNNQLTMSGEGVIPSNSSDWLSPDFRGDISASIHDLGDFAGLFGAERGDFAGEVAIEGTMNTRDRKIGGHLTLTGTALTFFKTSIDAFNARLNLRAPELEIEQFELKRKSDSLSAQGKIDISQEHDYSGKFHATVRNVADYLAIFRGPSGSDSKPTSAEIEANIEAATWDAHGVINLPSSNPFTFTANFPLRIGMDWNAFLSAPLNVTLEFPSIFLASAPQFLHPEIFRDGILSGKISLIKTLQHPLITGEVQLLNGKLQNAPLNLTEANGRLTFSGDRASIDSFNTATKDVDLSFRGDVDLRDSNALVVNLFSLVPIFDVTARAIDCATKIEFTPIGLTLAPAIAELEFHGGLFRSDWSVDLKTRSTQAPDALNETLRTVRLCPGRGADEKVLSLGAHPRPTPAAPRKRSKQR